MEKLITIHYEEIEGGAIINVGKMIGKELESRGYEVIYDTKYKLLKGTVINLLPAHYKRLKEAKRFTGYQKLINVFSPNPLEFETYELIGFLHSLYKSKDKLVCMSPWVYSFLEELMEQHFSYDTRTEILKNIEQYNFFVEVGKVKFENDKNKFIVPFKRPNIMYKNYLLHAQMTSLIKKEIPSTVHTILVHKELGDVDKIIKLKVYDDIRDAYENVNEYLKILPQFGLFISTSNYESFGMFYLEALLSGVIGVYLDKKWIRELLPDYPFIVSKADIVPTVKMIYKDYDKYYKQHRVYIKSLSERFSAETFISNLENIINEKND